MVKDRNNKQHVDNFLHHVYVLDYGRRLKSIIVREKVSTDFQRGSVEDI